MNYTERKKLKRTFSGLKKKTLSGWERVIPHEGSNPMGEIQNFT
jgi:hypothetical protein